jgi:hypothetical protein
MSGPITWWANRKSKIGLSPVAKKPPPNGNGREWWTTPPIAPPQPEHMEYAVQFQLEVIRMPPSERRNQLQTHIGAWMRAAQRLLSETTASIHGDLCTTDGLLLAARRLLMQLKHNIELSGGDLPDDADRILEALSARCSRITRERGVELAKRSVLRRKP